MTTMMSKPAAAKTAVELLTMKRENVLAALPSQVDRERFFQIAIAVANMPEARSCSPESVLMFVYGAAKLGLVPDNVLGHVYLVPFKGRATIIPGFRGLIELARRSGAVRQVHTELVREGDPFRYWIDEQGPRITHEPQLDAEDKPVVKVYCIAQMSDGGRQIEVMTRKQIDRVNTNSPPWKAHWDEMARKSVVRRASKLWPLSPELGRAVQWDEQADRGEAQTVDAAVVGESDPAPKLRSLKDDDEPPIGDGADRSGDVSEQDIDDTFGGRE